MIRIFNASRLNYEMIIENDSKNCYAYLMRDGVIVSDAWIFNVNTSPVSAPWPSKDKLPFSNFTEFVVSENQINRCDLEHFNVVWLFAEDDLSRAIVYGSGKIIADISPWVNPGWCVNAVKDGPLARAFSLELHALRDVLDARKQKLNGERIGLEDAYRLLDLSTCSTTLRRLLPSVLMCYRLGGTEWHLDAMNDLSGMGAHMKWMNSNQIIDEAFNFQPGIAACRAGYLPIGECLEGSGDPYFLKCDKGLLSLYRISRTAISDDGDLIQRETESISTTLEEFLKAAD